jgi:hypothetical protein
MARVIEEREVADSSVAARSGAWTAANIVYLLFGILEALLAFRFVFRLLGANPLSGFVDFIYRVTDFFVSPFYGIFGEPSFNGAQTAAVFDTSTIVAMLVYGLVAWVIVRLLTAASRPRV